MQNKYMRPDEWMRTNLRRYWVSLCAIVLRKSCQPEHAYI